MTAAMDRPNRFPWPPVVYVGAIAAAIVLGVAVPLPFVTGPLGEFLFALGWLVAAGGVAIDIAAMRAMRRAKTTILPHRAASHLVTDGPFAFSRNPIYLGNTMVMIGLGLILGNGWFLALAIVAALLVHKLAVQPEERHLEQRFGKRFRDYSRKVRRWI